MFSRHGWRASRPAVAHDAKKAENAVGARDQPDRDLSDPCDKACDCVMRGSRVPGRRREPGCSHLIDQRLEACSQIPHLDDVPGCR